MAQEWQRGAYLISTEKSRLNLQTIHGFLVSSYWSEGIPIETVTRAIEHSIIFGVYQNEQQVGFARVVTDSATFAYLADVFILDSFRGQGLGVWLMEVIMAHPDVQGLRRWLLVTKDAHSLYQKVGFTALRTPDKFMEKLVPDIYLEKSGSHVV